MNYEDPSGHIAISRIIGGVIGGGIGFLAGRKIAKKTKAKGWKKYAIIAGCTIGGAAIGALAGPRVAKVAKKAARLIKRKIPSRHIQKIQRVWNVTKKVARNGTVQLVQDASQKIDRGYGVVFIHMNLLNDGTPESSAVFL